MAAVSPVHSYGAGRMRSSGSKRLREGWIWCEGRVGSENSPAELKPKPSREPVDDFDFGALEENDLSSTPEGKVKCFISEQEHEDAASTFSFRSRDRASSPSARLSCASGNFTTVLDQHRQALSDQPLFRGSADTMTADRRPCFVSIRESGGARGDAEIRADAREVTTVHIDSAPDEAVAAAAMQRILGSFTSALLQHPTSSSRERSSIDGSRSRRLECPTPLFGTPPKNHTCSSKATAATNNLVALEINTSPSSSSARKRPVGVGRVCAHCGKSFSTESNLRRHIVSKHAHDTNTRTLLAAAAALVGNEVASPSLHVSPALLPKMTSMAVTSQRDGSQSYGYRSPSYHASVSPSLSPAILSHVGAQQTCGRPLSNFQKSLQNACVTQSAIRANEVLASSSRSPYIIQRMSGGSGDGNRQHSATQPTASESERNGSFFRTTNNNNDGSQALFSFVHEVQAHQWQCSSVYSDASAAVYQEKKRERNGNFVNHLPRPTDEEEESLRGFFGGDFEPMTGDSCVKVPFPPHFPLSCADSCLTVSSVDRGRAQGADVKFYGDDGSCHDPFMVSTTAPNLATAITTEPQNIGRVDRNSFEDVPDEGHDDRLSPQALCASFAFFVDDDSATPPNLCSENPSNENQSKGRREIVSSSAHQSRGDSDRGPHHEGMHTFGLSTFMDSETDLPRVFVPSSSVPSNNVRRAVDDLTDGRTNACTNFNNMSPPLPTSSSCPPFSFANGGPHLVVPINLESVRGTSDGFDVNWLGGLLSPSLSPSPSGKHKDRQIMSKVADRHHLAASQSVLWATNDADFHAAHFSSSSSCLNGTAYEPLMRSATPLVGLSVGLMPILDRNEAQVVTAVKQKYLDVGGSNLNVSTGAEMNTNGRSSSDTCKAEVVDLLNVSFTDIEDVKRLL